MSSMMQAMIASVPSASVVVSNLVYHINIGNVASYPGSGSTVADLAGSGSGNTTIYNTPTYTSANTASYLTTNGTNQYLLTPNLVSKFNSPSNKTYTLEAWIKTSSDNGVIVTEQGTLPINSGWHDSVMEIASGNLRVSHWTASGVVNLLVGAVTRNVWQHYVSTYDGTTLKGYINASTTTSTATARQAPWEYSGSLWYGIMLADVTSLGDGTYLAGDFAQFKLYNRALSAAEILQNFNATKTTYGL